MLNIYKSNKVEFISDLIAKKLLLNPPRITEKLKISVNNYLLGKWIRDQITINNQISALYEFQTITQYTLDLLKKIYPNNSFDKWDFESLKWLIISQFEEINKFKNTETLQHWISKYCNEKKIIDKDVYTFSSKIAKTFTDYLIYRPEIIYRWNKSKINSKNIFIGLNEDQYWQPILYKLIEEQIMEKPPCLFMFDFIDKTTNLKSEYIHQLPSQIYVLVNNNLSELQIKFYSKISEYTNVNLFLLSPGEDLWTRINSETGKMSLPDNRRFFLMPNIENIFGKYGANFQKLLDETLSEKVIHTRIHLTYIDPTISCKDSKKVSLLSKLQKQLIDNNKDHINIQDQDDSIIMKGNKDSISQLEFIREKICEMINSDSQIKYSDILISYPKNNNIKPYIKYVFSNNIIHKRIPYFLLNEDYKDISKVYNFVDNLLEISNKRISIKEIKSILNTTLIEEIFNINQQEKGEILDILRLTGFHWGIDSNDRFGEYKNTLDWSLERLTFGLIYDDNAYLEQNEIKPFSIKDSGIDINKWINILNLIKSYIKSFRGSLILDLWMKNIKVILNDIKNININYLEDVNFVSKVLDEISNKIESKNYLDIHVIRDILKNSFNDKDKNLNNRKNEVLIGDIEKIRLIPHRIIIVMDMNELYYPRKESYENFNLLNKHYKLGDPSLIEKEKYLFLELFISSRDKFIVTWSNTDRKNNKLEISNPLSQLKEYFLQIINENDINKVIINDNKDNDEIINSDLNQTPENYSLIKKSELKQDKHEEEEYKLYELINWFINPQLYWLNRKNIYPITKFTNHENDELISNYQKYRLMHSLIKRIDLEKKDMIAKIRKINIPEALIENAIIAPKNSIYMKEDELKELIKSLTDNLENLGPIKREYVKSSSNKDEYLIANNYVIELLHSNFNRSRISESWIRLLFLAASGKEISKSKIIYRTDNTYKSQILNSPGHSYSKRILLDYVKTFHNNSSDCFPIPPESSFKYVKALVKNKDAEKAFLESWIGNENFSKGERDKEEMKICFGKDKSPDFFLDNPSLIDLSKKLYKPIIDAFED